MFFIKEVVDEMVKKGVYVFFLVKGEILEGILIVIGFEVDLVVKV